MIKITIIIVIFLGGYFIFRQLLERFLLNKILSSSVTLAHLKYFESKKKDIQIFFLGACEFNSAIDPNQFGTRAFNFSAQIASYPEQYYFLKHYIGEMTSLKVVILSLGDNSFCSYAATGATLPLLFSRFIDYKELLSVSRPGMWFKLLWYKFLYSGDLGVLYYGRKFLTNRARRFTGKKRIELGRIKNLILQRLTGKKEVSAQEELAVKEEKPLANEQCVAKEASPKKKSKLWASPQSAVSGVKKHFSKPVFDKRAIIYFEKILNLCRARNIPVITVSAPRSKYFLDLSKEYITEDLLLEKSVRNTKYKKLIFKHLSYLDIYRERDDFFQPEGALLNTQGRREFSRLLAQDLRDIIDTLGK